MNKKIIYLICGIFSPAYTTMLLGTTAYKVEKPNIIIIMADDLGWGDLGYLGSSIKTPNIDKLSEMGVQLSRFYVAPISSPTRAGLLTGLYPNRFGLRETVIPPWRDFGIEPSHTMIPEFLSEQGYKNRAIIGKWHLGHSRPEYYPLNNGFTHFYGHLNGSIDYFTHEREGELDWHNDYNSSYDKGYATDLITQESVKCIEEYSNEGPFFLYIAFNAPHSPLQAKNDDLKLYGYDETKPNFSNKKGRAAKGQGNTKRQTYSAMVTCMDKGIGDILQALKDQKIEDNTFVLFLSDNGADEGLGGGSSGSLRGHKFQEFDGGVRSPAIIHWPARFSGQRVVNQLSGFVDIFPTICDIVAPNVKPPTKFDGISILKVLEENHNQIDRSLYLGCGAIIENDWKLIRSGLNPKMKLSHNVLYNLVDDPFEENDISAIHPEIMTKLETKAQEFDKIIPEKEVLPFGVGKNDFVPPKEWNIFAPKKSKL